MVQCFVASQIGRRLIPPQLHVVDPTAAEESAVTPVISVSTTRLRL